MTKHQLHRTLSQLPKSQTSANLADLDQTEEKTEKPNVTGKKKIEPEETASTEIETKEAALPENKESIARNLVKELAPGKFEEMARMESDSERYRYFFSGEKKWVSKEVTSQSYLKILELKNVEADVLAVIARNLVFEIYQFQKRVYKEHPQAAEIERIYKEVAASYEIFKKLKQYGESHQGFINARSNIMGKAEELRNLVPNLAYNLVLSEKFATIFAGEVNRFIAGENAPKVRGLYDPETKEIMAITRLSDNDQNLSDFVKGVFHKSRRSPTITMAKPIKGLYNSILIRLFLGGKDEDIKPENFVIFSIKGSECYEVRNINLGNAFKNNYRPYLEKGVTPERILGLLTEVRQQKGGPEHSPLYRMLSENSKDAQAEITQTLKQIAELKDADLQHLADNLSTDKLGAVDAAAVDAIKNRYLEILKENRDCFAKLYRGPDLLETPNLTLEEMYLKVIDDPKSTNADFLRAARDLTKDISTSKFLTTEQSSNIGRLQEWFGYMQKEIDSPDKLLVARDPRDLIHQFITSLKPQIAQVIAQQKDETLSKTAMQEEKQALSIHVPQSPKLESKENSVELPPKPHDITEQSSERSVSSVSSESSNSSLGDSPQTSPQGSPSAIVKPKRDPLDGMDFLNLVPLTRVDSLGKPIVEISGRRG